MHTYVLGLLGACLCTHVYIRSTTPAPASSEHPWIKKCTWTSQTYAAHMPLPVWVTLELTVSHDNPCVCVLLCLFGT